MSDVDSAQRDKPPESRTNDLLAFEAELTDLIGKPTHSRPFVCDGSPLDCGVFIVGFNPATEMTCDFWEFWRPGVGFDKAKWCAAYVQERRARSLKPGQRRRSAVSNTRRVLDWIAQELSPLLCLETNLYSVPTSKAADLSAIDKRTDPFRYLLGRIQPRVIVAHGKDACDAVFACHPKASVIRVRHLSRAWSEDAGRRLAWRIKAEYDAADQSR